MHPGTKLQKREVLAALGCHVQRKKFYKAREDNSQIVLCSTINQILSSEFHCPVALKKHPIVKL